MSKFLMDASIELNLKNKSYLAQLEQYVWQTYLNDVGKGDITTEVFVGNNNSVIQAKIVAKESGVFAGAEEAEWFLKKSKIKNLKSKIDGSKVKKGEVVMTLEGGVHSVLRVERTLLNLLQRMSGIATRTFEMKNKMPKSIQLLATRKTFWGDLDKKAVAIGGGYTHRLNLADAILIKENHITMAKDLSESLKSAFEKSKEVRFVEMEVENLEQVKWLIHFIKENKPPKNFVVMLDNFSPVNIKKAIQILKPFNLIIEASGGIDINNVERYCIEGLSAISSGSIINKAKALDLSMRI